MKNKFKIGDKVRLKNGINGDITGTSEITEKDIMTIKNFYNIYDDLGYRVEENTYVFNEKWLELVESKKTRGFEFISVEQVLKDLSDMIKDNTITNKAIDDILKGLQNNELKLPKRATKHSAGYDVFSPFEFTLKPNEVIKIPTLFRAYMQYDEVLEFYPRSSFGFKYQMCLVNTVAIGDSDYYNAKNEGHYWIKIVNRGDKDMHVSKGEAFAQAIFKKYLLVDGDNLDEGEERQGGIGSTSK